MSLELPPPEAPVRSGVFLFFCLSEGLSSSFFCGVLHPYSKVGNSRLQSTRLNYLRFYKYCTRYSMHLARRAGSNAGFAPTILARSQLTGAKAKYAGYQKGTSQKSLGTYTALMKNTVVALMGETGLNPQILAGSRNQGDKMFDPWPMVTQ